MTKTIDALAEALEGLLSDYVGIAESGDCGNWDAEGQPAVVKARAALTQARAEQAEPVECEGIAKQSKWTKCPITGRPYFMHLDHPEFGLVPTYGGPLDSYTVPVLEGETTDKWHDREMRCEQYDHDAGDWVEGGSPVPLRLIHEDELFALEESTTPPAAPVAKLEPLSREELMEALVSVDADTKRLPPGFVDFARAVEAAHNAKLGNK